MKKANSNSYQSGRWRRHFLPVFVWLSVLAVVIGLFSYRSQRFEVLGLAQGQVSNISSTSTGSLKSIPIELFQQVTKGQIVAILDEELLKAQITIISAEIGRLQAELTQTSDTYQAEAANRQTDWITSNRRFAVDLEGTRLAIMELRTQLETDRIQLANLALEVKITQELLDDDAISPYELQKTEVQYNMLAKKIEENEYILVQAREDLKQARQRSNEFIQRQPSHPSADMALDVIHQAIKVQEKRIEELSVQRLALILKSPFDGMVIQIQARVGEAVLAGASILTIAELKPREIIAYAREDQLNLIQEGLTVELIKNSQPSQIARSQVTHVSSNLVEIPARLWRNPNLPQWGRPFLMKIPPHLELIAGEKVGIRRLRSILKGQN